MAMTKYNFFDIFSSKEKDISKYDEMLDATTLIPEPDKKLMKLLNLQNFNAVVAGGSALRWYRGLTAGEHDVDIWFKNVRDFQKMSEFMLAQRYLSLHTTENADTYDLDVENTRYTVQLIKHFYTDIDDLLDKFDITVCRVASDGTNWHIGEKFSADLRDRRLRLVKLHPKILRRVIKYWSYGYEPDRKTLEMLNDPTVLWDYSASPDEDYQNAL